MLGDVNKWLSEKPQKERSEILSGLIIYLSRVDEIDKTCSLLLDYSFVEQKIVALGPQSIIEDYKLIIDRVDLLDEEKSKSLNILVSAIQQSAHILEKDRNQVASQLAGILIEDSTVAIKHFLQELAKQNTKTWLSTITPSLPNQTGELSKVYTGNSEEIESIGFIEEKGQIISGTRLGTIMIWDIETTRCLKTFYIEEKSWVTSVKVIDNKYLIAQAQHNNKLTLHAWDINTGQPISNTILKTSYQINDTKEIVVTTCNKFIICEESNEENDYLAIRQIPSLKLSQIINPENGIGSYDTNTFKTNRIVTFSGLFDENLNRDIVVYELVDNAFKKVNQFKLPVNNVYQILAQKEANRIIVRGKHNVIRILDLSSGETLFTIDFVPAKDQSLNNIVSVMNGRRILLFYSEVTVLWDVLNEKVIDKHAGDKWSNISVEKELIFSFGTSGKLIIWDSKTGELIKTSSGWELAKSIKRINDSQFISIDVTNINLWHINKKVATNNLNHKKTVTVIKLFDNDKKTITASYDNTIQVIDINNLKQTNQLIGHKECVKDVDVFKRGEDFFVASVSGDHNSVKDDNVLKIWNISKNKCIGTLRGHRNRIVKVKVIKQGKLAVTIADDNTAKLWDLVSGKCIFTFPLSISNDIWSLVYAFEIYNHEKYLITGASKGLLRIWDLHYRDLITELVGHTDVVSHIEISQKGEFALTGSFDNTIKLWDLNKHTCVITFSGHSQGVIKAVFVDLPGHFNTNSGVFEKNEQYLKSKKDIYVLSASADATLKLWSKSKEKCIMTFVGHSANITSLIPIDKRHRALSTSADGKLILWDLLTGKIITSLSIGRPIVTAALTNDKKTIIIGEGNGQLHFIEIIEKEHPTLGVTHLSNSNYQN